MSMKYTARNIVIRYGDEAATLPTVTDSATVYGDVRLWIKVRGSEIQAMARRPDESKSPVCIPDILDCDWIEK